MQVSGSGGKNYAKGLRYADRDGGGLGLDLSKCCFLYRTSKDRPKVVRYDECSRSHCSQVPKCSRDPFGSCIRHAQE